MLQSRISGNPQAPLLARSSHQIENFQAPSIEDFLIEADPRFRPPSQWKKRSHALRDLSTLPSPKLEDSLNKTLRPYQKIRVAWLLHLFRHQLGGILSDEMGLGKTLQALAMISAIRQDKTEIKVSLVVCPASLLENWVREAHRFCPQFSVLAHHGPNRTCNPEELSKHDLIITSYGTLVRDLELLESISFLCVIGDEAQHLKNRKTQNAKAMSSLSSEGRILLTGTPIENSVSDLLALLEFLLPGARPNLPSSTALEKNAFGTSNGFLRNQHLIFAKKEKKAWPQNFQIKSNKFYTLS